MPTRIHGWLIRSYQARTSSGLAPAVAGRRDQVPTPASARTARRSQPSALSVPKGTDTAVAPMPVTTAAAGMAFPADAAGRGRGG
ncbi:hypothetical protein IOD13_10635 [Brevibacterium casei]|nr:hypothetical protein [Brevibacterium casei]